MLEMCLACIVASPRLLESRARTIEQMRLINALCRELDPSAPLPFGWVATYMKYCQNDDDVRLNGEIDRVGKTTEQVAIGLDLGGTPRGAPWRGVDVTSAQEPDQVRPLCGPKAAARRGSARLSIAS